MTGFQKF